MMKKTPFILLLSLVCFFTIRAQNYQTIRSDRVSFFNDQNGNVKAIRIDSVIFQTDSVFFPFFNFQQLGDTCLSPYGASWIGNKVVVNNNGYNLFFNKFQDTIKIKTNALLNETWIAYEITDSIIVVAQITQHDTLSFLGEVDSVKTIGFQAYDSSMTLVNHALNDKILKLSKNYGWVKTLNFYLFPDYSSYDYNSSEYLREFDLAGLTNPEIGMQNLTRFDIDDFQPGDEIHIQGENRWWPMGEPWSFTSYKASIRSKYLERADYADSIVYKVERKIESTSSNIDSSSSSFTHDTIISIINRDSVFDNHLPGEPVEDGIFTYHMIQGNWLSKYDPGDRFGMVDSCLEEEIVSGCFYLNKRYIKGLGGPYYSCSSFYFGVETNRYLVYHKKGQETWGTPLSVKENLPGSPLMISVYPNPAKHHLTIRTQTPDLPVTFELIDIGGRVLMKKEIIAVPFTVNVEPFKAGMYLYRVRSNTGSIKYGKLIIE